MTHETVLADGILSTTKHSTSEKEYHFITITTDRVIRTTLGTPRSGWFVLFGFFYTLFFLQEILQRAKQLSSSSIPERLSAFPDSTVVLPLRNLTIEKSVWTGTKLVIVARRYIFQRRKTVAEFAKALATIYGSEKGK